MSTDTYDEIDLFELLEVLIKKWKLILGMVLAAALCVAVFMLLQPSTYKSGFTVLVDEEMPIEAVRKVLISQVYEVADKLPQTGEQLTVKQLSEASSFTVDEKAKLISLSVSSSNPEQVYAIANLWLENFGSQYKTLLAEGYLGLESLAETGLNTAQESHNQLFAEKNNLETTRSFVNKELINWENRILTRSNRLEDINIQLETETERLKIVNQQLQTVEPIIKLRMPITGFQGTLQIEEQEQLNSIYQDLLRQKIALSTSVAALAAENQETFEMLEKAQEQYTLVKEQLITLNNKLSELEGLIATKQREINYWDNELSQAMDKRVKIETNPLTIIQDVVKPEDREARGLMLNTVVAAFLAFFVGVFWVLLEHAWANRRQTGAISS